MMNKVYKFVAVSLLLAAFASPLRAQDFVPQVARQTMGEGTFILSPSTLIATDNASQHAAEYLADNLGLAIGSTSSNPASSTSATTIRLRIDPSQKLPAEGYTISICEGSAELAGKDYHGVFYAVQTFLQMLPPANYSSKLIAPLTIPCQSIEDYPAYSYRGVMLDVARAFMSVDEVKRYIDNLSRHKINILHWHLTDDEGWRIEIKAYPALTQVGAWRGPGLPILPVYGAWDRRYGGYYTQDQISDIVEYARRRAVEIIPEIDLPGHSRAAAMALPQILCGGKIDTTLTAGYDRRDVWCIGNEKNYDILATILKEVAALFPSKYLHIGGDEVGLTGLWGWRDCPDCRALMKAKRYTKPSQLEGYFMRRVSDIVRSLGKTPCAWDEAADDGHIGKDARIYAWHDIKRTIGALSRGYKTVVMPAQYFYIDMKQSPEEPGAMWAAIIDTRRLYAFDPGGMGLTAAQKACMIGFEGALWGETILPQPSWYRDYMSYPRICALAETAWCGGRRDGWHNFYARLLSSHLQRLAALGIHYRPFPPLSDPLTKFDASMALLESTVALPLYTSPFSAAPIPTIAPPLLPVVPDTTSLAAYPVTRIAAQVPPDTTVTIPVYLGDWIDREGVWTLRVSSAYDDLTLLGLRLVTPDTSMVITSRGTPLAAQKPYRLVVDNCTMRATLECTVRSTRRQPSGVVVSLSRSPYIEPSVRLTSSMKPRSGGFAPATDYNFATAANALGAPRKGDWFLFTFAAPVDAAIIRIETGYAQLQRCIIPAGHVETSGDGVNFVRAGELRDGSCTVAPAGAIRMLKVVSDGDGNGEATTIIRDLKITPR